MMASGARPIASVAIPTYGREEVLVTTIEKLLAIFPERVELLIVDQTPMHLPETVARLEAWHARGDIRLCKRAIPSIPKAMNHALQAAAGEIVIFLDDDIDPEPNLVEAHLVGHRTADAALIAGRVIQPWEEGLDFNAEADLGFAGVRPKPLGYFMGGNFSIRRDLALSLGGFDENFLGAAFNFEREFAFRVTQAGYRIQFEPKACIHHLKASTGGTRALGHHLTTVKPAHSVGAYYSMLRMRRGWRLVREMIGRPLRAVATRHHLKRPWWIPVTLVAELWGLAWAVRLAAAGPKYVAPQTPGP